MPVTTSKGLILPLNTEAADIAVLRNAFLKVNDDGMGATVCTSSTRPATPWIGQIIYETDTGAQLTWGGGLLGWRASTTIATNAGSRPNPPVEGQVMYQQDNFRNYKWIPGAGWVPMEPHVVVSAIAIGPVANGAAAFAGYSFPAWPVESIVDIEYTGVGGFSGTATDVAMFLSVPGVMAGMPGTMEVVPAAAGKFAPISFRTAAVIASGVTPASIGGTTCLFTAGPGYMRLQRKMTRYPRPMYLAGG